MENKLSVKNLVISFRTPGGKVHAVRDISFDLHKGETLAIVGESGSGKSVTSKAMLGILAGNSIVESGSIIYDGMDLLKITEEDFYRIRGDKIAMIFQDPLSSLNPIMRIGKQLTEAMLLKGKVRQKSSREAFNSTLALFQKAMIASLASNDSKKAEELVLMCKNFDKFECKQIELEQAYNQAHGAALEALDEIKDVLFHIEKSAFKDQKYTIIEILRLSNDTINEFVVTGQNAEQLKSLTAKLKQIYKDEIKRNDYTGTVEILKDLQKIIKGALDNDVPDFFSMGYYRTFASESEMPDMPINELNSFLKKYADEHFMNHFRECAKAALAQSAREHNDLKAKAISVIKEYQPLFNQENLDKNACYQAAKVMIAAVENAIDRLEIHKDSMSYTFGISLKAILRDYFEGIEKNKKAVLAHEKQQVKYDKLVAKGKRPSWKVAPSQAVDLELIKENLEFLLNRMTKHFEETVNHLDDRNFEEETEKLLAFFKENASGVVLKISKSMAKYKALKLMEEVGISDARTRYRQYPFEFSGGMRQRIVIAIALAANPDILICDEPTTALDVTIQAQILELINKLKVDRNLSIIFITHDLGVVANMADRIAVMYAGKIVETGTSEDVFYSPAHPYTWALLSAMPDVETNERLEAIPGTPPNMIYPPVGDAFADRNKYALKIDFEAQPPMFEISDTHSAATWLLHPDAPKVEPPKIILERINRMKKKGGALHD